MDSRTCPPDLLEIHKIVINMRHSIHKNLLVMLNISRPSIHIYITVKTISRKIQEATCYGQQMSKQGKV